MIHSKELSNQNLSAINNAVDGIKLVDVSYKNDIVDFIEGEYGGRMVRIGLPNVATEEEVEHDEHFSTFIAYHRLDDDDSSEQYFVNKDGSLNLTLKDVIEAINKFIEVGAIYDYVVYNGIKYLCREMSDPEHDGRFLTIATEQLRGAITSREDGINKNARDLDNDIFYYADEVEFQMSDEELFNHIVNAQKK